MKKRLSAVLAVLFVSVVSVFMASTSVYATNGMNLEGYGPIATGMGGASMAYDNGTAAVMNNPATLGLMPEGSRLDLALGLLGPEIRATCEGGPCNGDSAVSASKAFYMPAIGWIQKSGPYAYGVGVFAQGGMGTEFAGNTFLAAGSGEKVRSELGVGRLVIPLAYEVNKNLSLGATVDFVWATLDLKMALSGPQFLDMAKSFGGSATYGEVSGSMMNAFGGFVQQGVIASGQGGAPSPVNWGRFDFSDQSRFTGAAKATGFAGKLGGVYKMNDAVSVGLAYHSKTALGDLETKGATVSFNANVDTGLSQGQPQTHQFAPATIPLNGKIQVKEFQWPQTVGLGVAYQATDKLMIVADYKWINWADVMKNFKLTFTADDTQAGLAQGFAGTVLDATLFQNWKDQNVFEIGAGYKFTPEFTGRVGLNIANNPIPDQFMNPLFPAIEKNHVTVGAGYMITKASSVDASFTYAPEVKATNGQQVTVTHSQTNAQVMYSYLF
jgi:long-chain fatty acid transport protein